jgi:hypothetical protein
VTETQQHHLKKSQPLQLNSVTGTALPFEGYCPYRHGSSSPGIIRNPHHFHSIFRQGAVKRGGFPFFPVFAADLKIPEKSPFYDERRHFKMFISIPGHNNVL